MSFETTSQADTESTLSHRTPNLDYVFDDPAHGEPGRDRMVVHVLWELLLLLAVAGMAFLLYREDSGALSGDRLRELLLTAAVLGAVAAASAISLRAGSPNLAVGAVAAAAALYFGRTADGGRGRARADRDRHLRRRRRGPGRRRHRSARARLGGEPGGGARVVRLGEHLAAVRPAQLYDPSPTRTTGSAASPPSASSPASSGLCRRCAAGSAASVRWPTRPTGAAGSAGPWSLIATVVATIWPGSAACCRCR